MSLPFIKAQATGNDFIFIKKSDLKKPLSRTEIENLCSRRFGIGADGLVIIDNDTKDVDFVWDFYNSDGGNAEMCGNAARCATLIYLKENNKSEVRFKTTAGVIHGKGISDSATEVSFSIKDSPLKEISSPCGGLFPVGYLVDTGVPHFVIPTRNPWNLQSQTAQLAPYIFSPEFGSKGANLTFADLTSAEASGISAVTLERGVNDFTLSCGTGVIAVGVVLEKLSNKTGWKKILTPGGELNVRTVSGAVTLSGPAQVVYKGIL